MKEMDMLNITFNSLYNKINHLQKEKRGNLGGKASKGGKRDDREIERKMNANESHLKVQLMMLQEKVSGFQRDEFTYRDTAIVERMKALKDVELEYYEMRRKNKNLSWKRGNWQVSSSGSELAKEDVQEFSLPETSVVKTSSLIDANEQQPLRKTKLDNRKKNAYTEKDKQHSRIPDILTTENKVLQRMNHRVRTVDGLCPQPNLRHGEPYEDYAKEYGGYLQSKVKDAAPGA
ncbi:hypothetical protein GH714_013700 [Hevea brasiliensis]|uniref:Uncharacterized protein n=1 Tax=Hevea brasiliensis TaxID=3981 RepID=A0A6A6L9H3_HEVBR|nr:hypothetical protein GH714_013700 [Hevea brasiliensis]